MEGESQSHRIHIFCGGVDDLFFLFIFRTDITIVLLVPFPDPVWPQKGELVTVRNGEND